MSDILSLAGVSKHFHLGTPNEVAALRDVDFEVAPGDFVTIIGSNGAGKSSLLKAIAGIIIPDAGTVVFDGRDITRTPLHRRAEAIGRIAQDPNESTCAAMTIEENLAMAERRGRMRGLRRAVTPAARSAVRRRTGADRARPRDAPRRTRRHAVGRATPDPGLADGDHGGSAASVARRAPCGARSPHRRNGDGADRAGWSPSAASRR